MLVYFKIAKTTQCHFNFGATDQLQEYISAPVPPARLSSLNGSSTCAVSQKNNKLQKLWLILRFVRWRHQTTVLPHSLTSFCSVFSDHTDLLLSVRRFCWTKSETSDEIEFVLITKSRYKWNLATMTTVRAAGTGKLKMPGSEDDEGV